MHKKRLDMYAANAWITHRLVLSILLLLMLAFSVAINLSKVFCVSLSRLLLPVIEIRIGCWGTPSCKSVSDFRLVPSMPLCQGSCMDPIWPETEVGKILDVRPPEIEVPVTPGMSHGTKIFGSKIFSYHPQMILFYVFCGFVLQKMLKIEKNCLFSVIFSSFPYFTEIMHK